MNNSKIEIEKLLSDDSFVEWLEGEASHKNASKWESWLEEDPARRQIVKEARILHQHLQLRTTELPEMKDELVRLMESVDTYEASRRKERIAPVFNIRRKRHYWGAAAVAILLISVLSVFALFQYDLLRPAPQETATVQYITTSTQNGEKKVLTLFDGSTITLNANTTLKYPSQYSSGNLEVWLEGEAYFDIVSKAEPESRVFMVNVPDGKVEVLGTKFNVNAYEQDTEIALVEGSVNIEMRDSLSHTKDSYTMKPGEVARISRNQESIKTTNVDATLYTAWTQEKLVFDRTPLTKVAERITHIYSVKFQLDQPDLKKLLVSGSLPNNNLDVFLKALENMIDRQVTNQDGHIYLGDAKNGKPE